VRALFLVGDTLARRLLSMALDTSASAETTKAGAMTYDLAEHTLLASERVVNATTILARPDNRETLLLD
jgi:hypothetical protein